MSLDFSQDASAFDGMGDVAPEVPPSDLQEGAEWQETQPVTERTFPEDAYLVGDMEVGNFAESGLTDSREVVDYIDETIPPEHLEGLDAVEYVNSAEAYESGLMGQWQSDEETGQTTIEIYPHDDQGEMYDTVAHEIGHNAQEILTAEYPEANAAWGDLYLQSWTDLVTSDGEKDTFVSPYAQVSAEEDFAESYAAYLNDSDLLAAVAPQKLDFMETQVFSLGS